MQLTYNTSSRKWLAHTKYGETTLPRDVGFLWSPADKVWITSDIHAAAKLRKHAAADVQALLDAALVDAPPPAPPPPPVRLAYNASAKVWEARTVYEAGDVARAAGMTWDGTRRLWVTANASCAARLRDYADAANQALLDTQVVAAQAAVAAKAEADRQAIAASRATDADIDLPIAPGRSFLPYQKAGIAFGLAHPNVLLGDDMGLGKTAQAIGIINADESLRRILVICPASLTRNWVREFGFFASRNLTIGIATTKNVPGTNVVICTYDVFSRKSPAMTELLAVEWDALIIDECHYLKSRDTARTINILGGRTKDGKDVTGLRVSRRRIYLTGTPLPNRPVELWPIVHSLSPKEFPDFYQFAKRYCAAVTNGYGLDTSGSSRLDELQDKLRASIMVRRLKKDVLTELPAKRRQVVELPADTSDLRAALVAEGKAKAHQERIAELRATVELAKASATPDEYKRAVAALRAGESVPFEEMSAVRHRTAVAKAPIVAIQARDAVEAGGKVILFAHHRDVVDLLRTELADLGVVSVTGETPVAKRQAAVDAFQNDGNVQVFIGNIQAAGVGITLTASAHVIFAELDWVPGNVSQAEDRAHRIGQRQSVLVQHLVLEGSIDAAMARTIIEKQHVIDAALDDVQDPAERDARITAAQANLDRAFEVAEGRLAEHLEAEEGRIERAFAEAATAHMNQERVSASALILSPETVSAIHQGLRILAGLDWDGAREVNGAGYNKIDTYLGRALAAKEQLTAREAVLGQKLVKRYRRQLPADLLAVALETAAPPIEAVVEVPELPDPVVQAPAVPEPMVDDAEENDGEEYVNDIEQPPDPSLDLRAMFTAASGSEAVRAPVQLPTYPAMSDASVAAVHACLILLADSDADLGRDATFLRSPRRREMPTLGQAWLCKELVDRHRNLLPVELVGVAMGEIESPPKPMPAEVTDTASMSVTARERGRRPGALPKNGTAAMTAAERQRAWRAAHQTKGIEVSAATAERLKLASSAQGISMDRLIRQALEALEREKSDRIAA